MRRVIYVFIATAMALALAGCATEPPVEEEAPPTLFPTPVRPTYTVQRGDVIRTAEFFGRVTPVASKELFFSMDGRVSNVYVQLYEDVRAGQLLADLDVLSDLQAEWATASEEAKQQEIAARHIIRQAEVNLEIARLTLDLYKLQGRSSQEIRIQELQVELAQLALDEVNADPALHSANSQVKELEAQMADAQLVSPIEGTVIAMVDAGRSVRTTAVAFIIGDIRQLEIAADADEAVLKELIEDLPVSVTLESQPDQPLTGTIRQLPYPYGSGNSRSDDQSVRITLKDLSQGNYNVGDRARITLDLAKKAGVLWLPPNAIRTAAGRAFVILQTDAGPKQVNITTGVQTSDRIEIMDGLNEGNVVIGP